MAQLKLAELPGLEFIDAFLHAASGAKAAPGYSSLTSTDSPRADEDDPLSVEGDSEELSWKSRLDDSAIAIGSSWTSPIDTSVEFEFRDNHRLAGCGTRPFLHYWGFCASTTLPAVIVAGLIAELLHPDVWALPYSLTVPAIVGSMALSSAGQAIFAYWFAKRSYSSLRSS